MRIAAVMLGFSLLLLGGTVARAVDDRSSLRGLSGVMVMVHIDGDGELLQYCDSVTVQTRIELKLRKYGVRIADWDDPLHVDNSQPYLVASVVGVAADSSPLYAISVRMSLNQLVWTQTKPSPSCLADTWSRGEILCLGSTTLKQGRLYEAIEDQCDQFVNDWLAAHAK